MKDKINRYIIITALTGLILIGYILYIVIDDKKKNIEIDKNDNVITYDIPEIKINVGLYDETFKVTSLVKNANNYTKLGVTIVNLKNKYLINNLQTFDLLDENDDIVSSCYCQGTLTNIQEDDIVPNRIEANSKSEGYLYCRLINKSVSKLKITVIADGNHNDDGSVDYQFKDYYIDLK